MSKKPQFKDARAQTFETRKKIGFPIQTENWRNAKADFSEHKLMINDHPVMEDWENDYMKELATIACLRGGTILEVGFGMGISASYIQTHDIQKHIIVEANQDVFIKLLEFAQKATKTVVPVFGFWQDVTKIFPDATFDGILFDTYPLRENEVHINHFSFFSEAYRLLKIDGILTYYSDEITDFSKKHKGALKKAGFKKIEKTICNVNPPPECLYWKSNTIVVPIVRR